MLKEIFVENYKSLKNAKVEFNEGLNIIIGKNGSGKSNLLEFIYNYCLGFLYGVSGREGKLTENFSCKYILDKNESLELAIKNLDEGNSSQDGIKATISFNGETSNEYNLIKGYLFTLPEAVFKKIVSYASSQQLIKFDLPDDLIWLDKSASFNFVFDVKSNNSVAKDLRLSSIRNNTMIGFEFKFFFESHFLRSLNIDQSTGNLEVNLRKVLNEAFADFLEDSNVIDNIFSITSIRDVRISANSNVFRLDDRVVVDNLTLEFLIENSWIPWSYLSDGTKRLFYLITQIAFQEDGLILVEEPELGIHPHQLHQLMQFIKEQSEQKQIIVSTHSPIVLDALRADELGRITIAKLERGSSSFYGLTEDQIFHAKKYMTEVAELSYYWLHSDLEEHD